MRPRAPTDSSWATDVFRLLSLLEGAHLPLRHLALLILRPSDRCRILLLPLAPSHFFRSQDEGVGAADAPDIRALVIGQVLPRVFATDQGLRWFLGTIISCDVVTPAGPGAPVVTFRVLHEDGEVEVLTIEQALGSLQDLREGNHLRSPEEALRGSAAAMAAVAPEGLTAPTERGGESSFTGGMFPARDGAAFTEHTTHVLTPAAAASGAASLCGGASAATPATASASKSPACAAAENGSVGASVGARWVSVEDGLGFSTTVPGCTAGEASGQHDRTQFGIPALADPPVSAEVQPPQQMPQQAAAAAAESPPTALAQLIPAAEELLRAAASAAAAARASVPSPAASSASDAEDEESHEGGASCGAAVPRGAPQMHSHKRIPPCFLTAVARARGADAVGWFRGPTLMGPAQLADYHAKISRPMDFSTARQRPLPAIECLPPASLRRDAQYLLRSTGISGGADFEVLCFV